MSDNKEKEQGVEGAGVSVPVGDKGETEKIGVDTSTVGGEVDAGRSDEPDADAGSTGSGGGTQSPQDVVVGSQPRPYGTAEGGAPPADQFTKPKFQEPEEIEPPETADEDFSEDADEVDPKSTHQGNPGSGVRPGAALPGESVDERNARKTARVQASELRRTLENGSFKFTGVIMIDEDTGGFDMRLGTGLSLAEMLYDLDGHTAEIDLRVKNI